MEILVWELCYQEGHYCYIRGYVGIVEKKMETTIKGLGFRVDSHLITPPPFKGLSIGISINIPIKGRGVISRGLG